MFYKVVWFGICFVNSVTKTKIIMKKVILALILGSGSFVYGQNVESTNNTRKYLFHFKSDSVKTPDSVLYKNRKETIPIEERRCYKNKLSGYFNINVQSQPISSNRLYLFQYVPLLNGGIITNNNYFLGIDFTYGIKDIYTNQNISNYSNSVTMVGLGLEGGKFFYPDKLISFAPFLKTSYNYLDINKSHFSEYQLGDNITLDKDWFLKTTIGLDIYVNISSNVRIGLGTGYTKSSGVKMNYLSNEDLSGMAYIAKIQFHSQFRKIFTSFKKNW